MKTIKITPAFAILLQTNSWVIINEDYAVGAYKSRTLAREAKAGGLAGSVKNISEVEFEIIVMVSETPVTLPAPLTDPTEASNQPKLVEPTVVAKANEVLAAPAKASAGPILHKSEIDHPCKRVWGIAEDMKKANPQVKRGAVLAACVAQGIAYYTARTQYQQWLGIQKEMAERVAAQAAAKV